MEKPEYCTQVEADGTIHIPERIRKLLGLEIGDEVVAAVLPGRKRGEGRNRFQLSQIQENGEEPLLIPTELLEDAGIPANSDLEVVCLPGKLIIFAEDGDDIPKELEDLFTELGISEEKVRAILYTEEEK